MLLDKCVFGTWQLANIWIEPRESSSAQLHATGTEWRISSPTVSPQPRETSANKHTKSRKLQKIGYFTRPLTTQTKYRFIYMPYLILAAQWLGPFFLFITGIFTAGKRWYQVASHWHDLATSRTFTRNSENCHSATIRGVERVFGDSGNAHGETKKESLELWRHGYKCFHISKI